MTVATWKILFMGLLGIFFVMVKAHSADTTIGYDCNISPVYMTRTIPLPHTISSGHALSDARLSLFGKDYPDEFAFRFMGDFGYRTIMGDGDYRIYQCLPVTVDLIPQTKCYNQMPIERNGKKKFLNPWTRTITRRVYEMPCDSEFLVDFEIEGRTYKVVPTPVYKKNFEDIKHSLPIRWKILTLLAPTTYIPEMEYVLKRVDEYTFQYKLSLPTSKNFIDDNGNKYGSKHPHNNMPLPKWYLYWNTYSISTLCGIILGIILIALVIKLIVIRFNRGSPPDSIDRNANATLNLSNSRSSEGQYGLDTKWKS